MKSPISRRTALGKLAAGAASPLITSAPARAAAPPVGAPTGSSYRFKIGEFEVTALYDGYYPLKTETFVTNQPVEAVIKALDDVFLPPTIVPTPMTPLVINTGKNLVLIDTGNGDLLPDVAGYTAKNMRAAGIDPAAIDTIIISHFHVDHVCGIRLMDGTYQFPNARIHVPELEWAHWMDDSNQSRAPERQQIYFNQARRIFLPIEKDVERFGDDQEIVPGIRSIWTPGHTPGHTSFMVTSGEAQLLVWGDVTNFTDIVLRFPLWTPSADMDQQVALSTRMRMLDMATADRMRVSCFHDPFPGNGYIRKITDEEYRLVPLQWTEHLDGWK